MCLLLLNYGGNSTNTVDCLFNANVKWSRIYTCSILKTGVLDHQTIALKPQCTVLYSLKMFSLCPPLCRWHQMLLWRGSGALFWISGVFHICLGTHGPHWYPLLPLWLGGLWQVRAVCCLQPGLVYGFPGSVEEMQRYVSVRVGNAEPQESVWRTEAWIPWSSGV